MDTTKQDKAFKEIIKSTGYESAPDGLVSSVLIKLEADKRKISIPVEALIPYWVWIVIVLSFIGLFMYTFFSSPDIEIYLLSEVFQKLSIASFDFSIAENLNFIFQISCLENLPRFLIYLLPVILIQFFFVKYYYEGRLINTRNS